MGLTVALLVAAGAGAGVRSAAEATPMVQVWGVAAGSGPAGSPSLWAWLEEAARQVAWGPAPAVALGFSVVGAPLLAAMLWVRGYMMGYAAASAVWGASWSGWPSLLVGVLPAQLAGCTAAAVAAAEAIRFSLAVFTAALGRNPHHLPAAFGRFVGAALAAVLLAVGAGWLGVYGPEVARFVAAAAFR